MIVGVAGILLLSCPVGANGAAAARGVDGKVGESAVGLVVSCDRRGPFLLPVGLCCVGRQFVGLMRVWRDAGEQEAHGPKYMLPQFGIQSFIWFAISSPSFFSFFLPE